MTVKLPRKEKKNYASFTTKLVTLTHLYITYKSVSKSLEIKMYCYLSDKLIIVHQGLYQ